MATVKKKKIDYIIPKYVVRLNTKAEGFVGIVTADSKAKLIKKVRAHAIEYGFSRNLIFGKCDNSGKEYVFKPTAGPKKK